MIARVAMALAGAVLMSILLVLVGVSVILGVSLSPATGWCVLIYGIAQLAVLVRVLISPARGMDNSGARS